jgi:hypothetical protein
MAMNLVRIKERAWMGWYYRSDHVLDIQAPIAFATYFTGMVSADVTFVGHSKGGGEAIAAAAVTGVDAITFNAANFAFPAFIPPRTEVTGNIRNFYVEGDILYNILGPANIGTTIMLPSPQTPPTRSEQLLRIIADSIAPSLPGMSPSQIYDGIYNHVRDAFLRAVEG